MFYQMHSTFNKSENPPAIEAGIPDDVTELEELPVLDAIQEDILNQEQKDKEKEALERIERGEELESQDGNTQEEDQNDDRY